MSRGYQPKIVEKNLIVAHVYGLMSGKWAPRPNAAALMAGLCGQHTSGIAWDMNMRGLNSFFPLQFLRKEP